MTSPLALALSYHQPIPNSPTATIGNTDVVGAYRDAYNQQMEQYKAQLAQQNAMWGGLAGLGGAAISAFGGPIAKGLFSGGMSAVNAGTAPGVSDGALNYMDAAPGVYNGN